MDTVGTGFWTLGGNIYFASNDQNPSPSTKPCGKVHLNTVTMFKMEGSNGKRGQGRGQDARWLVCSVGSFPLPKGNEVDSNWEQSLCLGVGSS